MFGETHGRLYCRRCASEVPALLPWRGWNYVRYGWYGTIAVMLTVSPIMAADYCIMIPTMMGIILAGSTVHWISAQKPVCQICSLDLELPKKS